MWLEDLEEEEQIIPKMETNETKVNELKASTKSALRKNREENKAKRGERESEKEGREKLKERRGREKEKKKWEKRKIKDW